MKFLTTAILVSLSLLSFSSVNAASNTEAKAGLMEQDERRPLMQTRRR